MGTLVVEVHFIPDIARSHVTVTYGSDSDEGILRNAQNRNTLQVVK